MQNSQEINWLAILAPSIIVGLSAIIVQILLAYWLSRKTADYQEKVSEKLETHKKDLSKEIEDYKKELNKELEGYKLQIQSDFQTKFYEFQTRFSHFHQQKITTYEEIFSLLVITENTLKELNSETVIVGLRGKENNNDEKAKVINQNSSDLIEEAKKELKKLRLFYEEKCIYFSDNLSQLIEELLKKFEELIKTEIGLINSAKSIGTNEYWFDMMDKTNEKLSQEEFIQLKNTIKNEIKQMLVLPTEYDSNYERTNY